VKKEKSLKTGGKSETCTIIWLKRLERAIVTNRGLLGHGSFGAARTARTEKGRGRGKLEKATN